MKVSKTKVFTFVAIAGFSALVACAPKQKKAKFNERGGPDNTQSTQALTSKQLTDRIFGSIDTSSEQSTALKNKILQVYAVVSQAKAAPNRDGVSAGDEALVERYERLVGDVRSSAVDSETESTASTTTNNSTPTSTASNSTAPNSGLAVGLVSGSTSQEVKKKQLIDVILNLEEIGAVEFGGISTIVGRSEELRMLNRTCQNELRTLKVFAACEDIECSRVAIKVTETNDSSTGNFVATLEKSESGLIGELKIIHFRGIAPAHTAETSQAASTESRTEQQSDREQTQTQAQAQSTEVPPVPETRATCVDPTAESQSPAPAQPESPTPTTEAQPSTQGQSQASEQGQSQTQAQTHNQTASTTQPQSSTQQNSQPPELD